MSETAKKAVDVGATLVKWGIKGAGYVAGCGIKLTKATLEEVGNLAAQFSGCKLGQPIGNFMVGEAEKAANYAISSTEKLSIAGVNYLANRVKSRL